MWKTLVLLIVSVLSNTDCIALALPKWPPRPPPSPPPPLPPPPSPPTPSPSPPPLPLPAAQYDFFYLVYQWPASYCNSPGSACQRNPVPDYFTLHGMWPDVSDASKPKPEYCSTAFVPTTSFPLQLQHDLDHYWPNLRGGPSDEGLWAYQWRKHGSCGVLREQIYFKKAITRGKTFDLLGVLSSAGIRYGGKYQPSQIYSVIASATKLQFILTCNQDVKKQRQFYQLQFCVDKLADRFQNCTISGPKCGPQSILFPSPS